jgi:hypothetical protein
MTDDELDRRLRAQRPRAGWAESDSGSAVLERIRTAEHEADDEPEDEPRRPWVRRALVAAAAVLLLAGAAVTVRQLTGPDDLTARPTNGQTVQLDQGGYAYDVTSLPVVLAHNDTVFAGRVDAITDRDESEGWTSYRVEVIATVKGSPPAEVAVRQRGYVDEDGTSHVSGRQPILEVGRAYLLATSAEPGGEVYTVAPGEHAARVATDDRQLDALIDAYQRAG